jgi:ATP-dependent Lon protease
LWTGHLRRVTMTAVLPSLFSQHRVCSDKAMTGEIMLSGLVLLAGGIKEKTLRPHVVGCAEQFFSGKARRA